MSGSMEYETPDELFQRLKTEFDFDVDVCASETNHKLPEYWDKDKDALGIAPWPQGKTYWMNPPYSRGLIGQFVERAFDESQNDSTVVCLLPASTSSRWFHDYCLKAHEIRFIKGRIQFVGAPTGAMFANMIVVFKQSYAINKPIISVMDAVKK